MIFSIVFDSQLWLHHIIDSQLNISTKSYEEFQTMNHLNNS